MAEANGGETSAAELNLTGEREFLTTESAQEALAPMLAHGSAIAKVTGAACTATNLHVSLEERCFELMYPSSVGLHFTPSVLPV